MFRTNVGCSDGRESIGRDFDQKVCCGYNRNFIRYGGSRVDEVRTAAEVCSVGTSTFLACWWSLEGFCTLSSTRVPYAIYAYRGLATVLKTMTDPLTRKALGEARTLLSLDGNFEAEKLSIFKSFLESRGVCVMIARYNGRSLSGVPKSRIYFTVKIWAVRTLDNSSSVT